MYTFLVIVIALIAVMMVLVVLVQSGKGGGLAGIAAGGATTQILGTRQAPDVLEKATWTLATLFIVLCIVTNFFIDRGEVRESVIQQNTQQEAPLPVQPPLETPTPDDAVPQETPSTPPPGDQPSEDQ